MHTAPFVLTLLTPLLLFGQQPAMVKQHRVSIGLSFSPSLCYRTVGTLSADKPVVSDRNGRERPQWGYDAGVTVTVPMSKRIGLESGLWFSSKGYKTSPQVLVWPDATTDVPLSSITRFTYNFLSIPVKATYTFGHGKLQGFVGAGLAMNVFIVQQVNVVLHYVDRQSTTSSNKYVGVSRFSLVPLISAGIRYPLTPKMHVKLEPVFQYVTTSLRPGLPVREHLYSGGLTIGLSRRF
jgi:hypothetical protein